MRIEFRRAAVPGEVRRLVAFDRRVFPRDRFSAAEWARYESYWMLLDGRRVGCCAFERHTGVDGRRAEGALYIASTGILPSLRGRGLGSLMKGWQLLFARDNGFRRILTNSRRSNTAMIRLNRRFGFRVVRTIADYYDDPREAAVVMEKLLAER